MQSARTVLGALLGAAAFAAILLPTPQPESISSWSPAYVHSRSAATRVIAQLELFRRADSRAVARAAERTAVRSGSVYLAPTPPRTESFVNNIRYFANAEAARMPRRDTSVRIVIAFAIDTQPMNDAERKLGFAAHGAYSLDVFLPTRNAPTTCTIVARAFRPSAFAPWDSTHFAWVGSNVLGPCAWYGAYGQPGRGIAAWLDSTQHGAVLRDHRTVALRSVSGRPAVLEAERFPIGEYADATTMLACTSGRTVACDAMLQRPIRYDTPRRQSIDVSTPGMVSRGRMLSGIENPHAGYVLAELERQLGADAFLAFWKSDLSFPEAFAAARGVSLNDWFSRELAGTFTYSPGPLPKPRTAIALFVLIAASIALGLWALQRREVFA